MKCYLSPKQAEGVVGLAIFYRAVGSSFLSNLNSNRNL